MRSIIRAGAVLAVVGLAAVPPSGADHFSSDDDLVRSVVATGTGGQALWFEDEGEVGDFVVEIIAVEGKAITTTPGTVIEEGAYACARLVRPTNSLVDEGCSLLQVDAAPDLTQTRLWGTIPSTFSGLVPEEGGWVERPSQIVVDLTLTAVEPGLLPLPTVDNVRQEGDTHSLTVKALHRPATATGSIGSHQWGFVESPSVSADIFTGVHTETTVVGSSASPRQS